MYFFNKKSGWNHCLFGLYSCCCCCCLLFSFSFTWSTAGTCSCCTFWVIFILAGFWRRRLENIKESVCCLDVCLAYQWVSREKTCLAKIWSFDAHGKNLTFAETIKSDCSYHVQSPKKWHFSNSNVQACLKTIDKEHESICGLLLTSNFDRL